MPLGTRRQVFTLLAAPTPMFDTVTRTRNLLPARIFRGETLDSTASFGAPATAKVAVTPLASVMVTSQVEAPEHEPDQPTKLDPGSGEAVRTTSVPLS